MIADIARLGNEPARPWASLDAQRWR